MSLIKEFLLTLGVGLLVLALFILPFVVLVVLLDSFQGMLVLGLMGVFALGTIARTDSGGTRGAGG